MLKNKIYNANFSLMQTYGLKISTYREGYSDMVETENRNVKIHKCINLENAQIEAGKAAANTSGQSFPVVVFRQGQRWAMSGALPLGYVRSRLQRRSAKKRGDVHHAIDALNRPLDDGHAKVIGNYLVENINHSYILPGLTLNVQQAIDVFVPDWESTTLPAYLVIPMTAMLSITDGQHRQVGVEYAAENLPVEDQQRLDQDSIAVMITCETNIDQIHQDFADCSKTKALPKSQLAVYDRRNPANGLVLDIAEGCPLFRNKIDATSKSLSSNSLRLFLANQVRQYLKELLIGSYAISEPSFESKAVELLGMRGSSTYNTYLKRFVEYTNEVTQAIPVLKAIAELDTTMQLGKIKEYRAEGWVCLTSTGLNVIGRIGHKLMIDAINPWQKYAQMLGTIDWRRDADIWQGNIIKDNRVMTQQGPLRTAVAQVAKAIGLES